MFFLLDLHEEGVIKVNWKRENDNSVDMFIENLVGPALNKYAKIFVGEDEYMDKA